MTDPQGATAHHMPWSAILQVTALNAAVTLLILPLDSTLNRVMIVELGISATLTALLISLRFLTSPLRIWIGRISDRTPIGGLHRTWYIALGMFFMTAGFLLAPHAAFGLSDGGTVPLLFALFAFGLLGFGVNFTTPLYFAVVADHSNEDQRPKIVSFMFVILGLVLVVAATLLANALEPYSTDRLFNAFYVISGLVLLLTVIGLVKLEKPHMAKPSLPGPDFAAMRKLVFENREVGRFFLYLVLTFIAVDAQEVILEPYGAEMFGMTPDQTTRLTAIFRSGFLVMLIAGVFVVRRLGYRRSGVVGIAQGILGFVLIIFSGYAALKGAFLGGVFLVGLAAGQISITNLSLMMGMTDVRNSGLFLGTWGFAQAVGVGGGTLLGGVLRDIGSALTGSSQLGYVSVFSLELLLFLVSLPLLFQLELGRFRDRVATLAATEVVAAAARD